MKTKITWDEYIRDINKIYEFVKNKNIKHIYGIPRGGLIIATILSHRLDVPLMTQYIDHENVLVVDDIADRGESVKKFQKNGNIIATIYKHKTCPVSVDFYVHMNDDWVVFPYEQDVDTVSQITEENRNEKI